ncbi:hypothetical protein MRX96_007111 [Rhipicephalus microplus]
MYHFLQTSTEGLQPGHRMHRVAPNYRITDAAAVASAAAAAPHEKHHSFGVPTAAISRGEEPPRVAPVRLEITATSSDKEGSASHMLSRFDNIYPTPSPHVAVALLPLSVNVRQRL